MGYAFFSLIIIRPLRALGIATQRAAQGDLASPIQVFTTRSPGAGTGLGLAITQRLVARVDGTIKLVESTEGAHFQIRLPRAESDD